MTFASPFTVEYDTLASGTGLVEKGNNMQHTILLVDDDVTLLKMISTVLTHSGYQVITAESGQSAMQAWKNHTAPIDLIFTDVFMHDMSGIELAGALVALQPGLKVIFTSGADREEVDELFTYPETFRFLKKPVSIDAMVDCIKEACQPAASPATTTAAASPVPVTKAALSEKFALIHEQWRPKIVAQLNGQELKLVKVQGVFPWHHHAREDELFLVWRGELTIEFRDHRVVLQAGELCVVPHGVEHRTLAGAEAEVLVFEPAATCNTGNVTDAKFTAPNGVVI